MIKFQNINTTHVINCKATIKQLETLINEEEKELGEIVYVFCTDNYLLKKNIQYLNHDYLTDVITFDYSKKEIISGDILISTHRVEENAKIYNVDFFSELQRVMIHGLLHLLGYKDKTELDKKVMREKEDYYLEKCKSNL